MIVNGLFLTLESIDKMPPEQANGFLKHLFCIQEIKDKTYKPTFLVSAEYWGKQNIKGEFGKDENGRIYFKPNL